MRRYAHPVEMRENVLRDAVVEDALAVNDLVLLLVEGSRVVLEELNQRAGLRTLVENLALAFINAPTGLHSGAPRLEEIHPRLFRAGSRPASSARSAAESV